MNKQQKFNNQFKKRKSTGEQRNGRLSPFKNHNPVDGDDPNEYVNKKDD